MIGRKSLITKFSIGNYSVLVQANKNHGICDIIISSKAGKTRVPEILSKFQGRQYDDPYIIERLADVIEETLYK